MQENNRNIIQEDEIDLRELFLTLWKNKVFIAVITAIITILAGIYAYTKTPIYEAKALIEIGEYKLNNTSKASIDNANTLEKKLTTLFIDMEENTKERISKVTTIKGVKGLNSFLEVRTEGISNDEAIKEIKKVLDFVKNEHSKILDDVKKQKDLELTNIDLQISDVK